MAQLSRQLRSIGIDGIVLPSALGGRLGPTNGSDLRRGRGLEPAAPPLSLMGLSRTEIKAEVPRVLFGKEISEMLGNMQLRCSAHSGQNPTTYMFWSYNPLTGEAICQQCHDFKEECDSLDRGYNPR